MGAGIDYGMGRSNVDVKTGIRYGVISMNSVSMDATGDFENDYPELSEEDFEQAAKRVGWTRSKIDSNRFVDENGNYEDADSWSALCELDGIEAYNDCAESIGWHYDSDGYQLTDCLDSDIFVLASPYYTFAAYCSPCVPGAGNLDSAIEDGAKTYCLGHDWFEDGKAPYPVYSVETGKEIAPDVVEPSAHELNNLNT